MDQSDAELMTNTQIIFDPVAKTAIALRFDTMITVPGRFETYDEAYSAYLRVMRKRYAEADTRT